MSKANTTIKSKVKTAIIGSGNIGTDLMLKILTLSKTLDITVMVGIDVASDGLCRARDCGVTTCHGGIDDFIAMDEFADVDIVFDATSAAVHAKHHRILSTHHKYIIDVTPAAIGPYTVPVLGIQQNLKSKRYGNNLNMVTCGGQATIPIVSAISQVGEVVYAEIIASIASRSAGPGTRANIDEFTETTARAIEQLGGARKGKAIIILNPAEPPLIMRDTVYCLTTHQDANTIEQSVLAMVEKVQHYVPGYRLKQDLQFEPIRKVFIPDLQEMFTGLKVSVFLEVEGAGQYLPKYAGNLDIMTSAAMCTAEEVATQNIMEAPRG